MIEEDDGKRAVHFKSDSGAFVLVCHDTGAANALSALACTLNSSIPAESVCIGPAGAVFRKNGITPSREFACDVGREEIELLFRELKPVAILLGTSMDSCTERLFCIKARELNIRSVAFIDFWINYGRRFSSPGTDDLMYLPDAVAVIDEDARKGAIADGIPEGILYVTGNPYWDRLINMPQDLRDKTRLEIRSRLGVSESTTLILVALSIIRRLGLNLGYDEKDLLLALAPFLKISERGSSVIFAIKPHPKESIDDLKALLNDCGAGNLPIIDKLSSFEAVAAADCLMGVFSSILFEAAIQGKRIVLFQPNLNSSTLEYLKIFDDIRAPRVINETEIKNVIVQLLSDELPFPDLSRLPFPVQSGNASEALCKLVFG